MKLWAKIITNHKIVSEAVRETVLARPSGFDEFFPVLQDLCRELDLACPVLLQSHISDYNTFGRVVFRASDFMEDVAFDKLEVENIVEKKRKNSIEMFYT